MFLQHDILDVDCEMKESTVRRTSGPPLLAPSPPGSPLTEFEINLTSSLSTGISHNDSETVEGTFGVYLTFPSHPGRIFGLSCRHVLFFP